MLVALLQWMGFPRTGSSTARDTGVPGPREKPRRKPDAHGNQGITRSDEGHPQERTLAGDAPRAGAARRQDVKPHPKAPAKAAAKAVKKAPAKKAPAKKAPAKAAKVAKAPAKKAPAKPVPKKAAAAPKAPAKKAAAPKAPAAGKAPAKAAPAKAPVAARAPASKAAAPAAPAKKPTAAKAAPAAPARAQAPASVPATRVAPAPAPAPAPKAASPAEPVRSAKAAARLAQVTVPSMPPSVASTAAKASYVQTPPAPVLTPPPIVQIKKDPKLANAWKTKSAEELTDEEVLAMPDSEYMNDKQMAFFRRKLMQLKQDILNNAGETTEHLREDTVIVPDPADRATIEEEHALELRTRDRERKLLKKIEQSIARIDAGDYGYCDETGEPIGVGRLLARPTATLSLEAQQRRELKQKMFGD